MLVSYMKLRPVERGLEVYRVHQEMNPRLDFIQTSHTCYLFATYISGHDTEKFTVLYIQHFTAYHYFRPVVCSYSLLP
jgi:hypothetical protein